jgi:hypothetical protein
MPKIDKAAIENDKTSEICGNIIPTIKTKSKGIITNAIIK